MSPSTVKISENEMGNWEWWKVNVPFFEFEAVF
jgi:hypothetical protein